MDENFNTELTHSRRLRRNACAAFETAYRMRLWSTSRQASCASIGRILRRIDSGPIDIELLVSLY